MKKGILIFTLFTLLGCSNPSDCFESTGKIIQKEIEVSNFNTINVGNEVTMFIKQGTTQKIVVETGEHLMDNIVVEVIDEMLYLKDENSCNLTRDYAITKIYVTSPNIKSIRSNTARLVSSENTLNYNSLTLISEDYNETQSLNIGDFNISVNTNTLSIVSNGISVFNIKGTTTHLKIGFYSGDTRFIGNELIAQNVNIIHKSTNDILVNPILSLTGDIYAIGDVWSYNHPNTVNLTAHYSGKLIFK